MKTVSEPLSQTRSKLPAYAAAPRLVRLTGEPEVTGTFQLPKMKLAREGFDITKTHDATFLLNASAKEYVRFDIQSPLKDRHNRA